MKNLEIERKFLVAGDFRKDVFKSTHIIQAYLNSAPERTVRVRIDGEKGFITVKGAGNASGASRFEWEKQIPLEEAERLLEIAEPGVIDKTRHLIRSNDGVHIWEVDEFRGENEGLILAEIELADEKEAFGRPVWLGEEVTGNPGYFNSMLIKNPFGKRKK